MALRFSAGIGGRKEGEREETGKGRKEAWEEEERGREEEEERMDGREGGRGREKKDGREDGREGGEKMQGREEKRMEGRKAQGSFFFFLQGKLLLHFILQHNHLNFSPKLLCSPSKAGKGAKGYMQSTNLLSVVPTGGRMGERVGITYLH